MTDTTPATPHGIASAKPTRRYRNPWGVDYATARRYGYPLPALTPLEELEQRVEELEREQALRAGMDLLP